MNNKFIISLIVCVIAAGGLGFYGGMVYGKQQAPDRANGRDTAGANFRAGQPGSGAGRLGGAGGGPGAAGGFSNGEIVNKDANSVTLKLMDGGSKIVLMSSSTRIGKMMDGTANDLANGTNVMVTGTANTDGSITASTIQIRPAGTAGDAMVFRGRATPPPQP